MRTMSDPVAFYAIHKGTDSFEKPKTNMEMRFFLNSFGFGAPRELADLLMRMRADQTATDNAITSQIQTAIARSITHDEIASLTIDGDSGDALAAIDTLIDSDTTETDYTMADYEGVDTMDIWACSQDDTNEMIWRLTIRFAEGRTPAAGRDI